MANSINTSKFNNKTKKILDRDTIEQSIINSNNKNLDGLDEEQKTELINDLVETELTKKHILNPDKIFEFNSDTQILTNKYPVKSNSPYNIDINAPDRYNDKLRPFFNYISGNINGHLKKNQTGNELIENAIELDIMFNHSSIDSKIKTSIEELINTANAIDTTDEYWVYDLETASGRNKYGYQELDDIQEISMKKYKKVIDSGNITRIIEDEKARIETVIGIDPDKAERYRKTLPNFISKKGFSSEKARIIAMRFAKYGHKNTEFDYGRNDGTVRINKFASDEDIEALDIEDLKKNIVRGIERFEKTYEVQQGYRMENGLSVQDDMVLSMINNINNDFTVGYNSRTFDNSILSTYASRMWRNMTPEQKFIYSEIYGFDEFRGPEILPKNNNHLDLLDLNRVLASANGKIDTIYNEDEIAKLSGLKGTLLQQEILGKIKVPNASATGSHTAGDDVNVLAHLVGSDIEGTGKSYLKTILEKAKNTKFDNSNIDQSSVLMTKQSSFFNDYNRKGFLNFSLDKRTGAIKTFNGVSLEADGSARDLGPLGKEFGLKKNTTYKINSVKKLNMTDEWQKLMKRFGYQDYERNNLVAVEFAPLIDENITDNEILEDPIFYIFNDIKEAEGFISGHVDNIGSIDPNTNELINSSSKEVAEKYARYVIDDNGVRKVADYDVKDLVAKSTMQRMNDPAARAVRSNNYTKNKNFLNVVKFFENNNVKAVEEQHKMLAMLTANEVAQGKALELNSQITQMLGYNDIQLNKKDLRSTTLSNFINSYKNYHSKRRLIEQVVKVVDTTPTQNNTEKQYIFENIMESFMTDIYEKANTNINAPLELYGKDLDYFEVNINGLFNKKHKNEILNETDDIFKINLKNGKEYSLVNDLLKRVYGNDKRVWRSKESRDTYGSKVLNDFMDVLKKDKKYKKIIKKIDYPNDTNPDIIAEKIIKTFQEYREKNPNSGFITAKEYQNVLGEDKVIEAYLNNISDDEIRERALIKKNNLPNYNFIDTSLDDDMESKVSEMVDKILMPSISTKNKNIVDIDEITHYASDLYGFTDNQTIVFKNAIKTARQELIQGYSDIFKAVVENGGSIAYNEKSKTAVMHMAGKLYNLDLMKIDIINGSPIGQIAGSKFSLGHMLNVSNAIKDDVYIAQNTKVTSNIAKAFEQAKIFKYSMNKATASDEKVNKFFSLLGMVNRTLREESYVEGKTIKDTFAFQTLNVKELYKALPLLADTMEQYDIWSDPKLINKIRKNKKALSKGKIPGSVAEAMRSDMQKIYNIAFGISPFENMPDLTIDQKLISMATGNVKDVHFAETDILGEFNAYPLLEYDNPNRPNMFQGINSKKYSLNDINKTISKHKDKLKNNDLDFKVRLKNQRNTSTTAEGVGEVVSEYISTVGKVSEIAYKKILKENKKAIIDKAPDHMKKAYAKAYEQLEGANLTEQAQITDGYVAELFFKDTEIQKINGRKQFINDTNVNTKVMQSRINAAMPKMKLKDGKLVFEYGVTSSVKRHDPILLKQGYANTIDVIGAKEALGKFGFAYSAKGTDIEINEDKITEILNENINNLLKDNGEIDSEKAYNYLDEIFNPYFYVKNTIQKGYHKSSSEVVEKHMTESATSGMGTLNDNIKNFLKIAKGKDGKNLSNLIGINYNDDTLNDVISQAFNSLSEDKKSSLGFNTSSDLFEAIEEEKYLKSNILFRQIEAFKGLSSIGLDDELKHRSAGLKAREFIKTLAYAYTKEDGLTDEEAYKKVAQQLSDFKVFEDLDIQSKDGSIIFGQVNDNNLRVDNFTKLKNTIFENKNYKKHFIRETLVNNEKESIAFAIARNSSSFNVDYSGTSRSYSNAEELKAEKNKLILNLKKENLSATEKDVIEDKIKDLDYRISIDLNNNKTMKITSRERDLMDANRYSDESFEKLKSRLLTSSEQNTNHPLADLYNTYFKRLEDPTGALSNDYNNKSVYSSLLDQYTKLHDIKMKNSREYTNSLGRAQLFNNGDMDAEHLLTKDYSKKHISDIVMPTGEGSNFLIDNPNSLFGKNMILETSTGKQIAVPKMPYKIYNDEVMMNEVTKAVSSLQNAEDTLHTAIMNGSHTEINKLKTSVNDKADNLKSVLDATTRNYLKYLDTTELTDVDYKKVNASIYMKGANNFSGYNTAKIDIGGGKMMSLGELAENDVHVAATWHGRDYFQDYLDNWEKYKDLGISSQEDMVDHLKTKGIIAQDDRYPNIRPFSTGPQRQFLSDDVKPGVAISTGVDMIRKKQDQDGDSKHFARIKYQEFDENGDVSYSSSRLEFDLKMQSDKYRDSVSQREIDYWNNIDSGIMHDAVISNRQGYRSAIARMEKENTIAKSLINIEDILNNAAEYENGPITAFIQNKDGIATLKNYERTIKSLEKEVLSQNKSYETMEHGDKVRTLTKHIESNYTGDKLKEYTKALTNVNMIAKEQEMIAAKAGKKVVGEVNVPLYGLKRVAMSQKYDSRTIQNLINLTYAVEEGNISKKSTNSAGLSLTERIKTSIDDIVNGRAQGSKNLEGIIRGDLREDLLKYTKEISAFPNINSMSDDDIIEESVKTVRFIGNEFIDKPNLKLGFETAIAPYKTTRHNMSTVLSGMSQIKDSTAEYLDDDLKNLLSVPASELNMGAFTRTSSKINRELAESAALEITHGLQGTGLAKTALGLAAAIMVTGYIGGNPTKPAEDQAEELSNDSYDSLQDEDLSIQKLPGGTGQGYVININAQSERGKEHVQEAIQKAMYSSITTDVNISMNIKDKTSNINSRFIDKLLTGVL